MRANRAERLAVVELSVEVELSIVVELSTVVGSTTVELPAAEPVPLTAVVELSVSDAFASGRAVPERSGAVVVLEEGAVEGTDFATQAGGESTRLSRMKRRAPTCGTPLCFLKTARFPRGVATAMRAKERGKRAVEVFMIITSESSK